MSTFRDVISSSLFLHVSHCDQIEGGRQREQRPAGQWQLSAGDLLHMCFQRYNFLETVVTYFANEILASIHWYLPMCIFNKQVLESLVTYIEYGIIAYFLQFQQCSVLEFVVKHIAYHCLCFIVLCTFESVVLVFHKLYRRMRTWREKERMSQLLALPSLRELSSQVCISLSHW